MPFGDERSNHPLGAIAVLARLNVNADKGIRPMGVSAVTVATDEQLRFRDHLLIDTVCFTDAGLGMLGSQPGTAAAADEPI